MAELSLTPPKSHGRTVTSAIDLH
ncbi:hypothetical protein A2U01_0062211, partial [Trifolium medium]|nr:hypothetical protein [Trifolium medium]